MEDKITNSDLRKSLSLINSSFIKITYDLETPDLIFSYIKYLLKCGNVKKVFNEVTFIDKFIEEHQLEIDIETVQLLFKTFSNYRLYNEGYCIPKACFKFDIFKEFLSNNANIILIYELHGCGYFSHTVNIDYSFTHSICFQYTDDQIIELIKINEHFAIYCHDNLSKPILKFMIKNHMYTQLLFYYQEGVDYYGRSAIIDDELIFEMQVSGVWDKIKHTI